MVRNSLWYLSAIDWKGKSFIIPGIKKIEGKQYLGKG